MDEYTVLCTGLLALLDGERGAGDLPSDALTAPSAPIAHGSSPRRAVVCDAGPDCDCSVRHERPREVRPAFEFAGGVWPAVNRELSRASWDSDKAVSR